MPIAFANFLQTPRVFSLPLSNATSSRQFHSTAISTTTTLRFISTNSSPKFAAKRSTLWLLTFASGGVSDSTNGANYGGGGGGSNGDDGGDNKEGRNQNNNKKDALLALTEVGRSLESLPKDLKVAIEDGRIPGSVVLRLLLSMNAAEKTFLRSWKLFLQMWLWQ